MNANVGFWEKTEGEQQKGKTKRTWRGVFVLAPFWWCSACSSAGEHGTSSHTSYCLGSVKKKKKESHIIEGGFFFFREMNQTDLGAYLVVPPEACQSVWVDHSEHQAVLVLPPDVFLITVVTQQLIHVVPQQPALWRWLEQDNTCCPNC